MDNTAMRKSRRTLILGVTAALVLTVTGSAGTVSADPPTAHRIVRGGAGYVLISEQVNRDGTVTDTWGVAGTPRVAVTGRPGLTVTITPDAVGATAPNVDKTRVGASDATGYLASGRSPNRDAAAIGASELVLSSPRLASVAFNGTIYDSWCVQVFSPDGKVRTDACVTRYLDTDLGGGNWYLAHKIYASGISNDTNWFMPDRLDQVKSWMTYPSSNQYVQWTPGSTNSVGSCTSYGISITSGQTGLVYSQSQTVCPNSFGPANLDTGTSTPSFGSVWNGPAVQGAYRGTESVDLLHSPSGASIGSTLWASEHWVN